VYVLGETKAAKLLALASHEHYWELDPQLAGIIESLRLK
jgi:hypothetical protein